jgi:hypothetical protein
MADDEELNRQIQQLANAIGNMNKGGGGSDGKADAKVQKQLNALAKAAGISTKELDRYTKGQDKNAKGSDKFAAAVAGGADKVRSLGTAFASSAAQIRENQESFASLNPMIDQAGRVAGGMIKGIGGAADAFGSSIPVIGGMVSGIAKAGTALATMAAQIAQEVGKAVTKELDTASGAMRELGQAGALGSKGITGIYDQAISAGLSIKSFSKIAGDSAEGLAFAFGDSAVGVAKFAKVTESMKPFQRGLIAMGIGADKQGELTAKYMTLQARQGNLQGRTDADLAKGSKNYITQLTALSRLTGTSVDEAQKAIDDQQRNTRMAAAVATVQAKYGEEAGLAMQATALAIKKMGGDEMGKGLEDMMAGNLLTAQSQAFAIAAGPMAQVAVDQLRKNSISSEAAIAMISKSLADKGKQMGTEMIGGITGANTAFETMLPGLLKFALRADMSAEQLEELRIKQENLKNTTDKGTQGLLDGQTNMREFNIETNRMAKDLLPAMGTAVSDVTKGLLATMKELNLARTMGAGDYVKSKLAGPNDGKTVDTQDAANKKLMTTFERGTTIAAESIEYLVGSFDETIKLFGGEGFGIQKFFQSARVENQTNDLIADGRMKKDDVVEGYTLEPRAKGGPVAAGQPYMVGENGPELFSPKTSGTIIPNNQIKPASELTAADIPKLLAELKGYDVSRDDKGMWSAAKKSDDGTSETINQFGTKTVSGGFGSITYDAKGNEISRSTPKLGGLQMSSYADGSTKESLDFTSGTVQGKMEAVNGQGSKFSAAAGPMAVQTGLGGTSIKYDKGNGNIETASMAGPKGGYDSLKDGESIKGMMDTITNVFAGNALGDAKDPGKQTNNEEMIVLLRELVSSQNRQVDTSDKLLQATYNN